MLRQDPTLRSFADEQRPGELAFRTIASPFSIHGWLPIHRYDSWFCTLHVGVHTGKWGVQFWQVVAA